jgi:hypothetical protein
MAAHEAAIFMSTQRTVICATNGKDGFPHLMPLWFVLRSDEVWAWTFAKSQKVRNLERDPRATLQIEAGTSYEELRGVMLKTEVTIHRETADVTALGLELYRRYTPDERGELPDEVRAMVHKQAPKRVALQFIERSRTSWDHRKL